MVCGGARGVLDDLLGGDVERGVVERDLDELTGVRVTLRLDPSSSAHASDRISCREDDERKVLVSRHQGPPRSNRGSPSRVAKCLGENVGSFGQPTVRVQTTEASWESGRWFSGACRTMRCGVRPHEERFEWERPGSRCCQALSLVTIARADTLAFRSPWSEREGGQICRAWCAMS